MISLLELGNESLQFTIACATLVSGREESNFSCIKMSQAERNSTALCILGMHRSGTSTVARAINLLGAHLGDEPSVRGGGGDNPEGFWEHPEIRDLHVRLLKRLNRSWNTTAPLPNEWHRFDAIRPFRYELKKLIESHFADHKLWAWKDPRTCLLLPLWRNVLNDLGINLKCVFVVRNPIDVATSLSRRDPILFDKACGIWFNYNIVALKDSENLPMAVLSYETFLSAWEPELRRCIFGLGLDWPVDEQFLQTSMNSFIRPDLHHNKSAATQLQNVPHPVQELYQILIEAGARSIARDNHFNEIVNRLSMNFHAYASFFINGLNGNCREQTVLDWNAKPSYLQRTLRRWQKSFRKRFQVKI